MCGGGQMDMSNVLTLDISILAAHISPAPRRRRASAETVDCAGLYDLPNVNTLAKSYSAAHIARPSRPFRDASRRSTGLREFYLIGS